MTPFDLETLDPAFFDVQTTNCHQKVENWSRVTVELAESFNLQVNFLKFLIILEHETKIFRPRK